MLKRGVRLAIEVYDDVIPYSATKYQNNEVL
jgi:hypothetical protein